MTTKIIKLQNDSCCFGLIYNIIVNKKYSKLDIILFEQTLLNISTKIIDEISVCTVPKYFPNRRIPNKIRFMVKNIYGYILYTPHIHLYGLFVTVRKLHTLYFIVNSLSSNLIATSFYSAGSGRVYRGLRSKD